MNLLKDTYILPITSPDQQIKACKKTLINLLRIAHTVNNPKFRKIVFNLIELCKFLTLNRRNGKNIEISTQLIRTTVSLFDIFIIDEMQSRFNEKIGGRTYGRAGMLFDEDTRNYYFSYKLTDQPLILFPKQIDRVHYTLIVEMQDMFTKIAKNNFFITFTKLDKFKDFLNKRTKDKFEIVYFSFPLHIKEIKTIVSLIKTLNILVILPFLLNEKIGGFALAGKNINKADEYILLPQSEPSRQDILEALLYGGLQLINYKVKPKLINKQIVNNRSQKNFKKSLNEIWIDLIRSVPNSNMTQRTILNQAKSYSLLQGKKRDNYINKEKQKLLRRYSKFFLNSNIYFTRSGLSATILGVFSALKYFKNNTKHLVYVHYGFYYEADILVKRAMQFTNNYKHENVSVFCINTSSNYPYSTENTCFNYKHERDRVINYVFHLANTNLKKDYFLIIDKTTDLFFQTVTHQRPKPPNLFLFEAASLTKYRNGDHNHFSGIFTYKGDAKLLSVIDSSIKTANGTLSERDFFLIQKLTIKDVKDTISLFNHQANSFINSFNKEISVLPLNLRWRIEQSLDSPQYIFLIPPIKAIIQTSFIKYHCRKFFSKKFDESNLREVCKRHKLFIKEVVSFAIKPFYTSKGFVRGSSFGLETTRITLMPGVFTYNGQRFSQKIPRISFGLKTSLIALNHFAKKTAKELVTQTNKVIKSLHIINLTAQDEPKTKQFIIDTLMNHGFKYNPKYHHDLDKLKHYYFNGGGTIFVLKKNKKIYGTIAVFIKNNYAEIKRFYINQKHQRLGYGSQMMDLIIQYCYKKRIQYIKIKSEIKFKKAHILYEHKKFNLTKKDKKFYYFIREL